MAITFRAASSVYGNNTTCNAPTGIQSGDMLVAMVYDEIGSGATGWAPPTGWTLLASIFDTSGTSWQHIYTKTAGASEPASYTWTVPAGSWTAIYIVAFTPDVGSALAVDAHGQLANAGSTASPNVTTTVNGDAILIFGTNYNSVAETVPSSPWTDSGADQHAGSVLWICSGYQIQSTAGSIGAYTWQASNYGIGSTIALSESAGSTVSGSATEQANSALAESAAQVLAPASEQANSALAQTAALVLTSAIEQSNSALALPTARVVDPAIAIQANSVLSVTGGLAGNGGGTLVSSSVLAETSARVLAPASAQSNTALVVSVILLASSTAASNSALSVSGQVVTPSAAIQANAALVETAALVLASPVEQSNAALALTSALVLASVAIQANSILSATGHIPVPSGYVSPVGVTTVSSGLVGVTTVGQSGLSATSAAQAGMLTGVTVKE